MNRPQEIIKGSINIGKQVFTITNQTAQTKTIDFVSIGTLSNEIVNAADSQTREAALRIQQNKKLLPLIQKLSQTEAEATQITFVEDQVSSFTELIDRQITTLETLLTDWKVLNNNMIQIQKNVEEGTYTDSSLLQKHFNQIKK